MIAPVLYNEIGEGASGFVMVSLLDLHTFTSSSLIRPRATSKQEAM